MKLFQPLYQRVITWSRHRLAHYYLFLLSFAESSFFPVPPDVMLAPMSLSRPQKAYYFAFITTIASVLGGALGYLIGLAFYDLIQPLIATDGRWHNAYLASVQWFEQWGVVAVLVAGFSPIPYKVFTITAGMLSMSFPAFFLASLVGRGSRFFLLAWLMKMGGEKMADKIEQYIEIIGWIVVFLLIVFYLIYKL